MPPNTTLRDLLERYRNGILTLDAAAAEIEGLRIERVGDIACLDLGRTVRCGMPEVVIADGKETAQLAEIVVRHAETTGRCIATRVTPQQAHEVIALCRQHNITAEYREAGRVLVLWTRERSAPSGGTVAIITAGTADIRVAEEAKVIAEEMGCRVQTAYDVGAAGIHRLFPALKSVIGADVFIVAAGREGTLPSVVAGLVNRPVIGIPVSTGYGYMGEGKAALASMLQSCSVLAVVNIDAGFVAGAFAARIAQMRHEYA